MPGSTSHLSYNATSGGRQTPPRIFRSAARAPSAFISIMIIIIIIVIIISIIIDVIIIIIIICIIIIMVTINMCVY